MSRMQEVVAQVERGRFTSREDARQLLVEKVTSTRRLIADPRGFSTYDPHWLIADAEHRLRWLDCAPEGANHLVAPLQGAYGVPMGASGTIGAGGVLMNPAYRRVVREKYGECPVERARRIWEANH